jgi:hypothetical protein
MGRYLKNTQLEGGSYAVQLPIGSTTVGPDVPVNAQIRFNQSNNKIEFYYNSQWNQVAKIGRVDIFTDSFTTYNDPGSINQFTMTNAPKDYIAGEENSVLVFIGGVQQRPIDHYNFSSGVPSKEIYLTPSATGEAGQQVIVIHNFNSTDAA